MQEEELLQFEIVDIVEENHLAKTYQLKLLNKAALHFKPGQFLTFIIYINKQEYRRSYSILTLPDEPLKVTIKKVDNGIISRHILANWKKGETVYSLSPAGRFFVEPQKQVSRDIFCFAAGSGIVPIYPQLRVLLKEEPQSIIHLVYSNHTENDSLFLKDLEYMGETLPHFNLIKLFSEPEEQLKNRGRLSNISAEILINKKLIFKKKDAVFLLCGPFSFMRMLGFTIGLMGFEKSNIRRENFAPEIMRSGNVARHYYPDTEVTILTGKGTIVIPVKSGENVLDATLKAGYTLPYSCKGGACGNCAAKCLSGSIYMSINEVLSDTDLLEGWVLTCTGYPQRENTVLDFRDSV